MIEIPTPNNRIYKCQNDGAVTIETNGIEELATTITELLYIVMRYQDMGGLIKFPVDTRQWKGMEGTV